MKDTTKYTNYLFLDIRKYVQCDNGLQVVVLKNILYRTRKAETLTLTANN